jgi:hypothetical protein
MASASCDTSKNALADNDSVASGAAGPALQPEVASSQDIATEGAETAGPAREDAAGAEQLAHGQHAAAPQPTGSQPMAPAEADSRMGSSDALKVKCRRCSMEVNLDDALENPKFRPELRWTCRSCHACHTQLSRHGIQLTSLLTEAETVAFFAEAKAVRENSCDSRLSYGHARGLLKQAMIESSSREDREGQHGEFQPLSYWQLRGYNVENIELHAECRDHPILGATYRVDITKKSTEFIAKLTEERIVRMENECLQRAVTAASASSAGTGACPVSLDLPLAAPEPAPRGGKKRKSPEEKAQDKEAAKIAREAAKKRQKLEATAVAAAGKHLPALQKLLTKVDDAINKAVSLNVVLPQDVEEVVTSARAEIEQAIGNATKMLNGAAKGRGVGSMATESLLTEKKAQEHLKKGHEAVRTIQSITKVSKGQAPKAKGKGKGAKKD